MARTMTKHCDVCGKPTERIVGKLHFIPSVPGVSRLVHSNYTHHADVGECCKSKLFSAFKFQPRVSQKEYQKRRRNGQTAEI